MAPVTPPSATPTLPEHLNASLAKLDTILKAGGDPKKIIAAIQALRNDAELAGDLDAAKDFTDAICLIQMATGDHDQDMPMNGDQGQASAPAPSDQNAPPPPSGTPMASDAQPDYTAVAAAGDLLKVGRTFSASNADAMHKAIQAIASKLAAAGDERAKKVMSAYGGDLPKQAPAPEAASTVKRDGAALSTYVTSGLLIQKTLQPVLDQLTAKNAQVDALIATLTRQPAPGGPVLRNLQGVEKMLPAQALAKVSGGDNLSIDEAIAILQKVHDETPDVYAKQQLRSKIAELNVKKGRGMV